MVVLKDRVRYFNCWIEVVIRKGVVSNGNATGVASEALYQSASTKVVLHSDVGDGNILTVIDIKNCFCEIPVTQTVRPI